ncbi:hypothetical protein SERLA73DRAFT_173879 [Serpula lacrymans var. lacrymans S7.3]|uniref:Uncharacterized protein n=2 Tax=Serpula lacrymans var. lacrymans TaxID=341189 RepID=F8PHW0_SERL3|nr:uncharacterized protein SERLADRAFT_454804 [Serpula lacrymans var. lacrymans S7.9]EGO04589.1 hypothetical protein SERLA73DRAFT_173879 [Serpula lacrymans var. lacrymans S7.3]EGO30465.1 hypothetical protein SERLADRAFT_454804 [Serpula lacrymans var. lacrymans S7.9]
MLYVGHCLEQRVRCNMFFPASVLGCAIENRPSSRNMLNIRMKQAARLGNQVKLPEDVSTPSQAKLAKPPRRSTDPDPQMTSP